MRWLELIASLIFFAFACVQLNDPDSLPWILIYSGTGALSLAAFCGYRSSIALGLWLLACLIPAIPLLGDLRTASFSSFSSFRMHDLNAERARESLGLLLAALWTLILWGRRARATKASRPGAVLLVSTSCLLTGCLAATNPQGGSAETPIRIPLEITETLHPRKVVLRELDNPRGVLLDRDGSLLVATAGNGGPGSDGQIVRFRPTGDGSYQNPQILLDDQVSKNLLSLVRRDEVFGVAAIKSGQSSVRATAAYYDGPSQIFAIDGPDVSRVAQVAGNLNDIAWHPGQGMWFGVSSSTNELWRLPPEGPPVPVVTFPRLADGQESVPGYLRHDPATGDLLVSLFSGSPLGEAGGDGTEIVPRAGKIVGVDPTTGQIRDVVTGLTAPTDLEVSPDGHTLWVLELCDRFVEPVTNRQEMLDQKTHGGFRRFSGRLLEIDRSSGSVVTIARELDTPTNLSTGEALLFVSTGMGTSGRNIPTPGGDAQPLEGRIVGIYRETSPASSRPQCRSTEILRRRFQHRSLMGR